MVTIFGRAELEQVGVLEFRGHVDALADPLVEVALEIGGVPPGEHKVGRVERRLHRADERHDRHQQERLLHPPPSDNEQNEDQHGREIDVEEETAVVHRRHPPHPGELHRCDPNSFFHGATLDAPETDHHSALGHDPSL